jgi:hypothetical protein
MVGLGTWITFNVGTDPVLLEESVAVIAAFFEAAGNSRHNSIFNCTTPEFARERPET